MAGRRWVVTATGARPLNEIVADLTGHGFDIDQTLDQIGVIVGTATDDVVADLRGLDGIADVSPEGQVDIGPPDSPTTW